MNGFLEKFRPTQCVESVAHIDLSALMSLGFNTLMLDLDNTLLPWKDSTLPELSQQWIQQAKEMGMKLCIVSNTHNPKRLSNIAAHLGIPSVCRALKPRKHGFMKAAAVLDSSPEHTVVVGDQLLTDILGGNLAGMRTILVRPMHRREFIGTKLSRLVERGILAILRVNR